MSKRATVAAGVWLGFAGAAAGLLIVAKNPALLVAAGCVLAAVEPERDTGGWNGFFSIACLRVGDTTLVAAIAWYLASQQHSPRAAATAAAVLALALLASYVRVRAASLSIQAAAFAKGASRERAVWLGVLAFALWAGMPDAPDALTGGLVAAGLWSAGFAAARAARIWRGAAGG
jgi:hypothetical protein